MAKKNRIEDWYLLTWNDAAGREQSMAGPHYALTDTAKGLKTDGIDYDLSPMGWVETAKEGEDDGLQPTD